MPIDFGGKMSDRIQELLSKLSLEEKAALSIGASNWTTHPVERLGIPEMIMSDGPHGLRRVPDIYSPMQAASLPATCFPTASCTAATWDRDLIHAMGEALGEECVALDVDVILGPGVNMKRSPLGGRNFEYFSEDPFLAGEMAASLINGIQSKGVGTSLKHYATNNQEFQRFSISAEIDERALREVYLAAFEKAVKQGKPYTVMCAYNKFRGTFLSENHYLLTDILKKEWGFEGLIMSDWGAVRNRVAALKGGLDLEMPGPQERRVKEVVNAVRTGELDEKILDESVRRILRIILKAKETPKNGTFDADAHYELARKIAAEGMVLLKNNGILPLKGQTHVAVIGRAAEQAHFQGGGSSHINPTKTAVPFNELKQRLGDAEFAYAEGYPTDNSSRQEMIDEAVKVTKGSDVAVLYIALPTFKESEGYDREDLNLTDQQIALIKAVAKVQPNTVVVLNNGSPVAMDAWIGDVAAVLESYMMGEAGGAAIADILTGKVNPSGKLAETFPCKLEDTPSYLNWPGETGTVNYGEGMFIGYRYYDAKHMPVLFPFGYGLSYTSFKYSNIKVSSSSFKDVDGVTISVDVTNTGKLTGKEIVELYVHDQKSSLVRPEKELKGFAKVELKPGETKTVSISLDFRAFAFYHPEYKQWVTEDGDFDLLVGASAADIRGSVTVTLKSTLDLPCILDKESTIAEWMSDRRGKLLVGPILEKMAEMSRKAFGGDNERYGTDNSVGMDIMTMFSSMPLYSVLMFFPQALEKHPDDLIADLLKQAHEMK